MLDVIFPLLHNGGTYLARALLFILLWKISQCIFLNSPGNIAGLPTARKVKANLSTCMKCHTLDPPPSEWEQYNLGWKMGSDVDLSKLCDDYNDAPFQPILFYSAFCQFPCCLLHFASVFCVLNLWNAKQVFIFTCLWLNCKMICSVLF